MDTKLDKIDLDIINSLMEDGRKSFRQIARETNTSTPTVESRFSRLKELGIIKNIQPIFDFEKFKDIILSVMYIKTEPAESDNVINELESFPEKASLYTATGEYNLVARVIAYDQTQLEDARQKIQIIKGIQSVYIQILGKTLKDKPVLPIKKENILKILCEMCGETIHSFSYKVSVGNSEKYFCCSSCLTLYKQQHNMQ